MHGRTASLLVRPLFPFICPYILPARSPLALQEEDERAQAQQAEAEARAHSEREAEEARRWGCERLASARVRIQELWRALESESGDRAAFLWECEALAPYRSPSRALRSSPHSLFTSSLRLFLPTVCYSEALLERYQQEIERLNDQLPLMEMITKREFIKSVVAPRCIALQANFCFAKVVLVHFPYGMSYLQICVSSTRRYRLKEFNKTATDPQRLFGADPSGRLLRESRQRKEYQRELAKLNESLLRGLAAYEKKYRQMFLYKGVQYLELMAHDIQDQEREVGIVVRVAYLILFFSV